MFNVQDPRQAMMQKFLSGQAKGNQIPFIKGGRHVLAVSEFKMIPTDDAGPAVALRAVVLETNNPAEHPIGSQVERRFTINAGPKFQGDKGERVWGELKNCVAAMFGMPNNTPQEQQTVFERWFSFMSYADANPEAHQLRGLVVICNATFKAPRQKKNAAPGEMTKAFTETVFEFVPGQNDQTMVQMRAVVEQHLLNPPALPAPAPQAAAWSPAQQGPAAAANPFAGQAPQTQAWPGAGQQQAPNPFGQPSAPPVQPVQQGGSPFAFGAGNVPQQPAAQPQQPAQQWGQPAAPGAGTVAPAGGPPKLW